MLNKKNQYAYYSGVIGLLITPIMIIIAFLLEPSYNPFLQTISKLGITERGQYVFILGAVVGGLSLVIFHYYYFLELSTLNKNIYLARLFGIISGIGLIGVGIIQDKPGVLHKTIHWLSAVTFFFFTILFIYNISGYLKEKSNEKDITLLINSGFIPIAMVLSYIVLSLFNENIAFGSIVFKIHIIWQKLTVLSFMVWYFLLFYIVNPKKLKEFQ